MSIGLTDEQRRAANHDVHQNQRERVYQDLRARIRHNVEALHRIIHETHDHNDFLIEETVSRIKALHFVSQKVAARLGLNLLQIQEPEVEREIVELMVEGVEVAS